MVWKNNIFIQANQGLPYALVLIYGTPHCGHLGARFVSCDIQVKEKPGNKEKKGSKPSRSLISLYRYTNMKKHKKNICLAQDYGSFVIFSDWGNIKRLDNLCD